LTFIADSLAGCPAAVFHLTADRVWLPEVVVQPHFLEARKRAGVKCVGIGNACRRCERRRLSCIKRHDRIGGNGVILTDNESKVDLLNNEAIAKTIIALLREKPDRPVTIGVHGDWGAGKSSILEMIESGLADQDGVSALIADFADLSNWPIK
jgi:hypothetical protein